MKRSGAALALALLVIGGSSAMAESRPVSQTLPMTFKTSLVPGSQHFFTFRLFDAATVGTELWTETAPRKLTVSPTRTIQWNLGSVVPFSDGLTGPVDFSQQLWIQFTGGGRTPARVRLSVVPYAIWSATSDVPGVPGPKGDPGEPGPKGDTGEPGPPGPARLVAGCVLAAGGISRGSGYSVAPPTNGSYSITFDQPFSSPPVCLCQGGTGCSAGSFDSTVSTVMFQTLGDVPGGQGPKNANFCFICGM